MAWIITVVLLLNYRGADTLASDNSDKNPFMLAVEKGHLTVAKAMVKKNPDLISMDIIHWALEKHLNTFFQVNLAARCAAILWHTA